MGKKPKGVAWRCGSSGAGTSLPRANHVFVVSSLSHSAEIGEQARAPTRGSGHSWANANQRRCSASGWAWRRGRRVAWKSSGR